MSPDKNNFKDEVYYYYFKKVRVYRVLIPPAGRETAGTEGVVNPARPPPMVGRPLPPGREGAVGMETGPVEQTLLFKAT